MCLLYYKQSIFIKTLFYKVKGHEGKSYIKFSKFEPHSQIKQAISIKFDEQKEIYVICLI